MLPLGYGSTRSVSGGGPGGRVVAHADSSNSPAAEINSLGNSCMMFLSSRKNKRGHLPQRRCGKPPLKRSKAERSSKTGHDKRTREIAFFLERLWQHRVGQHRE